MTRRFGRHLDRLRDERGMALVMALGVSFVLGILGASVILFTTSNERHSNRNNASTRAYTMAQGGIDSAASQLGAAVAAGAEPAETFFTAMPASDRTDAVDNGTVAWTGERFDEGAGFRWHVTSTASLPDPSSAGQNVTRTVEADVYLRPRYDQVPNTDTWKYVYSKASDGDPNTCDQTIYNNPGIISSFYVNGDLCLDNSSNVYGPQPGEPEVNVIVKGRAYLNHPATSLGTNARPLSRVEVGLGCKYRTNPINNPCTTVDRVWPTSLPVTTNIVAPEPDHDEWFVNASPGPHWPCLTGSTPFAFNDPGEATPVRDRGVGTVDLTPAGSYSCTTTMGELSWDAATKKLTVWGTVYIDGNVEFWSDGVIDYEGFGAIYLSGSLRLRQTIVCGERLENLTGCDPTSNWNSEEEMLLFVAGGTGAPAMTDAGMTFEQSSGWQGSLYSAGNMTFENNTFVQGPMIADRQIIQNGMFFNYIPDLVKVPFGAPGTVITEYDVALVTNYTG